jgi:hypothetical protein
MLSDGLTQKQGEGAGENVQIQDVSQMLLTAVKRGDTQAGGDGAASGGSPAGGTNGAAVGPGTREGAEEAAGADTAKD